jgi:hypothetical protein
MIMKKIIERLQKGPKLNPLVQSKLEVYRFRKLLENARAIMTLVADGHEKLEQEYIFDRHYVISLVDQVIERSGMIVFDAVVLAPEGGESLYRVHDQLKAFAIDQFIKENPESEFENIFPDPGNIPDESEFRLLFQVLAWIIGPLQNGFPTMMDFIRQIFDHVIPVLRNGHYVEPAKSWIELNNDKGNHRIWVINLESGPIREGRVFINELVCKPLGLMFIGASRNLSGNTGQRSQTIKNWIALTGKNLLSLRGMGTDNRIYLEAALSGHTDSDFIFIFAEHPLDLKHIAPGGFHMEKTRLGTLAWNYDVSGQTFETNLAQLGELLL